MRRGELWFLVGMILLLVNGVVGTAVGNLLSAGAVALGIIGILCILCAAFDTGD